MSPALFSAEQQGKLVRSWQWYISHDAMEFVESDDDYILKRACSRHDAP